MAHRITIPDALGGGWVDIKDKRSWADSNHIASSGMRVRSGLSQDDIAEAQSEGRMSDLMEIDGHGKASVALAVSALAWSDGLIGACASLREWLDSDDCDEDVGDFLLEAVEGYYAKRRRSKSGQAATQPDAGLSARADEGERTAGGPRALRDSESMAGVPA